MPNKLKTARGSQRTACGSQRRSPRSSAHHPPESIPSREPCQPNREAGIAEVTAPPVSDTFSEHVILTTDWVASVKLSDLLRGPVLGSQQGLFGDTTGQRLGIQVLWLIYCPFYYTTLLFGENNRLFNWLFFVSVIRSLKILPWLCQEARNLVNAIKLTEGILLS